MERKKYRKNTPPDKVSRPPHLIGLIANCVHPLSPWWGFFNYFVQSRHQLDVNNSLFPSICRPDVYLLLISWRDPLIVNTFSFVTNLYTVGCTTHLPIWNLNKRPANVEVLALNSVSALDGPLGHAAPLTRSPDKLTLERRPENQHLQRGNCSLFNLFCILGSE